MTKKDTKKISYFLGSSNNGTLSRCCEEAEGRQRRATLATCWADEDTTRTEKRRPNVDFNAVLTGKRSMPRDGITLPFRKGLSNDRCAYIAIRKSQEGWMPIPIRYRQSIPLREGSIENHPS